MRGEDEQRETAGGGSGEGESPGGGAPGTVANPFAGVRPWTVIPWMIIGTAVFLMAFHIVAWLTPLDLGDEAAAELAAMLAGYAALLTWILWVCSRSGVGLRQLVGRAPAGYNWLVMPGLLVVAMAFSIGSWFVFAYALSVFSPGILEFLLTTMEVPAQQSAAYQVGMFTVVVIMAPVLEEILFRGALLNRWGYRLGMGKALILTSLVFGILHANPVGITAFGLIAAILYLQTRTLIVPMVFHALNNLGATVLGYFHESSGPIDVAAGMEEIQASGLAGVILMLATLPVIVWYVRRHWPAKDAAGPYVGEEAPAEG